MVYGILWIKRDTIVIGWFMKMELSSVSVKNIGGVGCLSGECYDT